MDASETGVAEDLFESAAAEDAEATSGLERQIHDAPGFDPGGHLTAEDEARLFRHYGLDHGPVDGSGADSEFIAPATDRVEEEPSAGDSGRRRLRRHVAE